MNYKPVQSALYLGDELIWSNPPELGFFGIKLRKQVLEQQIIARIDKRRKAMSQKDENQLRVTVTNTELVKHLRVSSDPLKSLAADRIEDLLKEVTDLQRKHHEYFRGVLEQMKGDMADVSAEHNKYILRAERAEKMLEDIVNAANTALEDVINPVNMRTVDLISVIEDIETIVRVAKQVVE